MKLTPKEKNILIYVALGYTDKEIGSKMKLSYSTVRTYVDRGILKMSAKNRTHAAVKFVFTIKPGVYLRRLKELKEVL